MSALGQKRTFGHYSITSSARASTDAGTVRPKPAAAFALSPKKEATLAGGFFRSSHMECLT